MAAAKKTFLKWLKKDPPTFEEYMWTAREKKNVMEKITPIAAPDESIHGESG